MCFCSVSASVRAAGDGPGHLPARIPGAGRVHYGTYGAHRIWTYGPHRHRARTHWTYGLHWIWRYGFYGLYWIYRVHRLHWPNR